MKLKFLGKDSTPTNSPTLYATDHGSYIVQGWIVTDPDILTRLEIADDETVVEVPAALMTHLINDGLDGEVSRHQPPIVYVKDNGNYIVQGTQVTDTDALGQMTVPDHETCVEVSKSSVTALLIGG